MLAYPRLRTAMVWDSTRQRAVLFGFGVDAVQGRVAAMPMTCDELVDWLSARAER